MSDENNFKPTLEGYKPLRPFNLFMKNNFPFIENTFEALDTYGLLCEIVKYLNTVIENVNTTEENIGLLNTAFDELNDYVSHYFDNLDVQEEINNKLDEMATTGVLQELLSEQYDDLAREVGAVMSAFYTRLNSVASGSPLVASSTSGMTDTTKTYVNTTDGYWYYYNGTAWAQGGVYQSTGIANSSIGQTNLDSTLLKNHYTKTENSFIRGAYSQSAGYPYIDEENTKRAVCTISINKDVNYLYFYLKLTSGVEFTSLHASELEITTVMTLNTDYVKIGNGIILNNTSKLAELIFEVKKSDNSAFTTDEVSALKIDLYDNFETRENDYIKTIQKYGTKTESLEFGGLVNNNGTEIENTIRIRTKHIMINKNKGKRIFVINNLPSDMYVTDAVIFYKDFEYVDILQRPNVYVTNNFVIVNKTDFHDFNSIRFSMRKQNNGTITQEELESITITKIKEFDSDLEDEIYASMGDSVTYGFIPRNYDGYPGKLKSYSEIAAAKLGMIVKNYGISGSTVADVAGRSPMSQRYDDMTDDATIISVMGGTNDIRNSVSLGTIDDNTDDTFYGALKILAQGLYDKYYIDQTTTVGKKKKIFFCTPLKLLQTSSGVIGGTGTNYDMSLWCKAIKDVAEMYSFPVLDLYNLSGINPALSETVQGTETGYTGTYNPYITDGTHPTQEGQEMISDIVAGFIKTLKD